jgi:hypothetical protein
VKQRCRHREALFVAPGEKAAFKTAGETMRTGVGSL